MADKIQNYKFQITNKLQIPISKDQIDFVSNLGDWDLFEIWCLEFGASIEHCPIHYVSY